MKGNNSLRWNFVDPNGITVMNYLDVSSVRLDNQLKPQCSTTISNDNNAEHGIPTQQLQLACSFLQSNSLISNDFKLFQTVSNSIQAILKTFVENRTCSTNFN